MSVRPDVVECWLFRLREDGEPEFLLMRRSPGRVYAGLWQCVTGSVEADERVPAAALREVAEETGLGPADAEAFYDLDQVSSFYDERRDAVASSVIFALRLRPGTEPTPSHEHDAVAWVAADEAVRRSTWPSYRESIRRILELVADPARARWFQLTPEGRRHAASWSGPDAPRDPGAA